MKEFIKQHKNELLKAALILLWGIACLVFFQTQFCYHFYHQEQNQLFLLDWNYLSSYFDHHGWLACLVADFLTQFYYYVFAGPLILTLALLILGDLTRRVLECCLSFAGKKNMMGWIAFVIAILFMSYEARLCLDTANHLSDIIAIIGCLGMLYILCIICHRWNNWSIRLASLVCIGALTYWMFISEAILPAMGTGKWVDYDYAMKFEKILALDNEYYFGHYDKVVDLYEHMDGEKTDEMKFFYCLALEQQGQLANKLPSIENPVLGTFIKIGPDTPLFTIKMINELYYLIGDMTYTERAAIMANTFSPDNRNARMVKRMAEANLISGDIPAARKYLRLLSKTLVYRHWAKVHTPETMSPEVAAEIAHKHAYINKVDQIRLGDDCYAILTQLLDSNQDNLPALDYLLCSDMLSHQREVFIRDYEKYNGGRRAIFQEIYNSAKQ